MKKHLGLFVTIGLLSWLGSAAAQVTFFSAQFTPIEEQAKFRAILEAGGYDFTSTDEGPLLDQLIAAQQAGDGTIDVFGALHGVFPPLAEESVLTNMVDIADDLSDRGISESLIDTALLGSDDFLGYIPWAQATFIMAANKQALEYLPEGADINALTWEQLGEWCATLTTETGGPKCGLPHAGLFHRFLQGYLFPSFTGGMVTQFKSAEAEAMMTWARDSLWPNIHPESINYEFMQVPLLAGDVWVAFDHTARLLEAFSTSPEDYVAFPAPAGPAGRGYMPVIAGLGIPATSPNPEAAAELIDFLLQPETQSQVLNELGFFPVIEGVDTSSMPEGVGLQMAAVTAQAESPDAIASLLPVGLGERSGDINQIFRNAFDRIVLENEDIRTVLDEEGANLQTLLDETGAACWQPDPESDGPCQVN
ncbi:MAG: extracellular solute-binding protein [Trueperaceae bacterium]